MNQQEKLASLSAWMVGAIVFVVLILATVAIFGGQSGDASTLGGQLQMAGEGDVTIAQQLPTCPSATPCMGKEFIPGTIN